MVRKLYKYTTYVYVDLDKILEDDLEEILLGERRDDNKRNESLQEVTSLRGVPGEWHKALAWSKDDTHDANDVPRTIENIVEGNCDKK